MRYLVIPEVHRPRGGILRHRFLSDGNALLAIAHGKISPEFFGLVNWIPPARTPCVGNKFPLPYVASFRRYWLHFFVIFAF